jgi:hypothetical protein
MHRLSAPVMLVLLASFSTGCATLVRGDKQKMKFQTNAPNSTVVVDGKSYAAPATVPLKRNKPHTIVVSAPGYQSIQFDLKSQWDGASLPQIALPGGSAMFATDTVTGADKKFYTLATINLEKAATPSQQPVVMHEFRGKVLAKPEYDAAVKDLQQYHSRPVFGD